MECQRGYRHIEISSLVSHQPLTDPMGAGLYKIFDTLPDPSLITEPAKTAYMVCISSGSLCGIEADSRRKDVAALLVCFAMTNFP
jgi:hypothetical protein